MITIDWQHFTPALSAAGGALIGLAAAVLIMFNGRVAGISGIAGGLFTPARGDVAWRVMFLVGLVVAPVLYGAAFGLPAIHIEASTPTLIIAGLLVGVGTRYGAGCTSGHGVCGLSRFSLRSLAATLTFMAVGFAVATFLRHQFSI
jgi:uncharacterized protein